MASPSKSSRIRKLPSPRKKDLSTKSDGSLTKYLTEASLNGMGDNGDIEENGKLFSLVLELIDNLLPEL